MAVTEANLGPLHRADGSATYSHAGYSVICAVNGPIEVQRRDEIPDEAAIEVNVRPAVGVGGMLQPIAVNISAVINFPFPSNISRSIPITQKVFNQTTSSAHILLRHLTTTC